MHATYHRLCVEGLLVGCLELSAAAAEACILLALVAHVQLVHQLRAQQMIHACNKWGVGGLVWMMERLETGEGLGPTMVSKRGK